MKQRISIVKLQTYFEGVHKPCLTIPLHGNQNYPQVCMKDVCLLIGAIPLTYYHLCKPNGKVHDVSTQLPT